MASPKLLAILILVGLAALIFGVLIGKFSISQSVASETESTSQSTRTTKSTLNNDYELNNDNLINILIYNTNIDNLKYWIKLISKELHPATSKIDDELALKFRKTFLDYGFDRAYLVPYRVLLSSVDPNRPNIVYLIDVSTNEPIIIETNNDNHLNFNSYSPSGDITAEPVYCNYGRVEDFELLEDEARIQLDGKICLIRYGKIFRGNKIANAQRFGCAGVLLYSDPESMAPFDQSDEAVFPNSIWMNGKAIQSGNVRLKSGDPLTPGYPSIVDGYYEDLKDSTNVHLPLIPSQPIGYHDAKLILSRMSGWNVMEKTKFGNDWFGKLTNITYRLGPGFQSQRYQLRMVINNKLNQKIIYNLIAILDGNLEQDRYILIGNHRDSWAFGALDSASGTAAILESARIFGEYHKKTGWRPRRSLVFASWAAEEQGLIGSTEWTEQFASVLKDRAVTYINVDTCVYGPIFNPDATPSLANVLKDATKLVPAHPVDTDGQSMKKNQTLYESWLQYHDGHEDFPVEILSSGSDHEPFAYGLGIPSINLHFKHDKKKYPVSSYPAYHTIYETYDLVSKFIDPNFTIHQTCSRLINVLLYSLSTITILPHNFTVLSQQIINDYQNQKLEKRLIEVLKDEGEQSLKLIENLNQSIIQFSKVTVKWHSNIKKQNLVDELSIRRLNDMIMLIDRILASKHLYKSTDRTNMLYGTLEQDSYRTVVFPGLSNLLQQLYDNQSMKLRRGRLTRDEFKDIEMNRLRIIKALQRHLVDIIVALQQASKLLQEDSKVI